MLARRTKLHFPNGSSFMTPLLVPSFSSKGWRFKEGSNGNEISEIKEVVEWSTEFLTDAVLYSAYDLYYNHYPGPKNFGETTDITFIDSGGYEKSEDHDFSSVYRMPWPSKEWDVSFLKKVINELPKEYNIVIINYDDVRNPRLLEEQIEDAKNFFEEFPQFLHDFLIRTETKKQNFVQIKSILDNISLLGNINVIALTEKELGNSILERMVNLANIRIALDEEGIKSPIHVFGSLDPITSCLYFISGAEIFDGLTWLRYAYNDGMAVYNENYRFLERGLTEKSQSAVKFIFYDNLATISELTDEMISFARDGNFSRFSHHGDNFKRAFERLQARIGREI